jgi:hypothetical protein
MNQKRRNAARAAVWIGVATCGALLLQCGTTRGAEEALRRRGLSDWNTVYRVLQHPRCKNCHPAGDAPLQGEASLPHAQNVQRGPEGKGVYAMRCDACHQTHNQSDPRLPPGGPNWHLPEPEVPLVFEGKSSSELARQLGDPERNGHLTREGLLEHVMHEPLVLWGWDPGPGRQPVTVPHEEFVAAMRGWIEAGCPVPE